MKSIRYSSVISVLAILLLLTSGCTGKTKADSTTQNKENTSKPKEDEVTNVEFYCVDTQKDGEQVLATVVNNDLLDNPLTLIYWDGDNQYFGEKWSPQKRCETVSERFQSIHDRNGINFITNDVARWLGHSNTNIICGVEQKYTQCEEEDLLFTLQSDDEPDRVLQEIIALRSEPETGKPLKRGGSAQKVRVFYNLEKELKPKIRGF